MEFGKFWNKRGTLIGTIVFAGFVGGFMLYSIFTGILFPGEDVIVDEKEEIDLLTCSELKDWLSVNENNKNVLIQANYNYATKKFIDECSSY